MSENLPKVIKEGKLKIGGTEITVCVLDNGKRIIPEEDFLKLFSGKLEMPTEEEAFNLAKALRGIE